jgi:hypothetical protein
MKFSLKIPATTTTTTTPKYHVYFSPKPSINNKMKIKRKEIDDIKDENENETINQHEIPSSSTEQSKISSGTAPITRRSINTRSVPNTAVEQEEEKSRRLNYFIQKIFFSKKIFSDSQQCFLKIPIVGNHNQWLLFNFFSHISISHKNFFFFFS